MTEANVLMDNFMYKLAEGGFREDKHPNEDLEINMDFVEEQVSSYSKFLNTGIIEMAISRIAD